MATGQPNLKTTYYLIAYNTLSFLGWAYLLVLTLIHVFNLDDTSDTVPLPLNFPARSLFADLFSLSSKAVESRLPPILKPVYFHATTTYSRLGQHTIFVQTFATLEIIHVLVGWVKAPLFTTLMQVASRLYAVWAVYPLYPQV